ncbi:hypothetical protein Taro_048241, partial [Colocasia esculenta]|nr:hypothetical protein [Colocasia esculenta]
MAISGDVDLEASILKWFWRTKAAQSVENADRASFYEFFLHGPAVVRGLQVWYWLDSTVLWLYCVVVEQQLDLSSVTARLRVVVFVSGDSLVVICDCLLCAVLVAQWHLWYLVTLGVEVNLCSVEVIWCDLPLVVVTLLK